MKGIIPIYVIVLLGIALALLAGLIVGYSWGNLGYDALNTQYQGCIRSNQALSTQIGTCETDIANCRSNAGILNASLKNCTDEISKLRGELINCTASVTTYNNTTNITWIYTVIGSIVLFGLLIPFEWVLFNNLIGVEFKGKLSKGMIIFIIVVSILANYFVGHFLLGLI